MAEGVGEAGEKSGVSPEDAGDESPGTLAALLELGGGAVAAAHGEEVMEVTHGGGKEGRQQAAEGKVFDDEEEAVAFDEVGLEFRGAAGGVGVAMFDDGGGGVAAGPTGPAGAEAEVGVFAVEEEGVVKAAGFGEHGGAVEGGGAAGEEDFFIEGECRRGKAVAALFAGAIGGDEHTGGIERIGFAVEADLGGDRTGGGVMVERIYKFGEPGGVGDGIVINYSDELGGQFTGGEIDGGAEADVIAGVEDGDVTACGFGWPVRFHTFVTAVIDDHDTKIRERLPVQAVDTFPQGAVGGESRNNDGDPIRLQISIVRRTDAYAGAVI